MYWWNFRFATAKFYAPAKMFFLAAWWGDCKVMTDTLGYMVLYLSKCLAPSNEPGDFTDFSLGSFDFWFSRHQEMIGNSSMPGEVSKALAIWTGMHSQHGRRNPRKSWRIWGGNGNKMLKTVTPQPSKPARICHSNAIKLRRIQSGSSNIGQQMMLLPIVFSEQMDRTTSAVHSSGLLCEHAAVNLILPLGRCDIADVLWAQWMMKEALVPVSKSR